MRSSFLVLSTLMWLLAGCAQSSSISGGPAGPPAQPAPPASSQIEFGPAVGLRAPDFTVTRLDGSSVAEADLRAEKKPYILYFYASW